MLYCAFCISLYEFMCNYVCVLYLFITLPPTCSACCVSIAADTPLQTDASRCYSLTNQFLIGSRFLTCFDSEGEANSNVRVTTLLLHT